MKDDNFCCKIKYEQLFLILIKIKQFMFKNSEFYFYQLFIINC